MTVLPADFFLIRKHWGHVAGYSPYRMLIACSPMHLLHGHRVHAHNGHRAAGAPRSPNRDA